MKARETYETPWTARGYRVAVEEWTNVLVLTCEAEAMRFDTEEKARFVLGQVGVLNWQVRGDAERFVAHAFSFYGDDELTAAAVGAVRKVAAKLREPSDKAPATPQRGGLTN